MNIILQMDNGHCVRIEIVPAGAKEIKKVLKSKAFEKSNEPWNLLYKWTGFRRVEMLDEKKVPEIEVCLFENEVFIRVD